MDTITTSLSCLSHAMGTVADQRVSRESCTQAIQTQLPKPRLAPCRGLPLVLPAVAGRCTCHGSAQGTSRTAPH